MTALTPLIEADFDFEFGPYRLQPYQRIYKRDPELTSPYGDNNHALPPFVPSEVYPTVHEMKAADKAAEEKALAALAKARGEQS